MFHVKLARKVGGRGVSKCCFVLWGHKISTIDPSQLFLPQPWLHPRLWCRSRKSFSHCPGDFCWSRWQGPLSHVSMTFLIFKCFNCFLNFPFVQPGNLFSLCATLAVSHPEACSSKDSPGLLHQQTFTLTVLPLADMQFGTCCIVFRFLVVTNSYGRLFLCILYTGIRS